MKRIALIYDFEQWVLGNIAKQMASCLNGKINYELVPTPFPKDRIELNQLQRNHYALHFLTQRLFEWYPTQLYRKSIVTTHHLGSKAKELFPRLLKHMDVPCVTNHDCLNTICEITASKPTDFFHTPYGIDTTFFSHRPNGRAIIQSRFPNLSPNSFLLGLAASPNSNEDERKGFDRYWNLLRELNRAGLERECHLIILGPSAETKNGWKPELIPSDVAPFIHITGFVSREDLPSFYCGLDYYLCLSRLEGGPYPVLECMSCGVPVISTWVGSVINLIEDGISGWIVNEEDHISKTLSIISQNSFKEDLIRKARETLQKRHSFDSAYDPLLYNRIYATTPRNSLLRRLYRFTKTLR
ncbi:MAG: glycosyltransferase family 4 protein [Candidatus Sumerlaeia bacterium]|nr:glycosyltransferase family 4 protein [Candidatus Sumerlaeia bacterium]